MFYFSSSAVTFVKRRENPSKMSNDPVVHKDTKSPKPEVGVVTEDTARKNSFYPDLMLELDPLATESLVFSSHRGSLMV